MAKLICVSFSAVLLILWTCGGRSHAYEDCQTRAHPEQSPTHPHTLERWTDVTGMKLSCGDMTEVVRLAKFIVDFIDEFKDSYTQIAWGISWDEAEEELLPKYNNLSIQVCMENNQGCIPVLPDLEPYVLPKNEREMREQLVTMIGYLLRYSVAAETLVLDQSFAKNDLGFLGDMTALLTQLEELIELFQRPLSSCNLTPHPKLVRGLSRRMYQRVDENMRKIRGFTGLREIRLGLHYIYSAYVLRAPARHHEGIEEGRGTNY